jgi:hypothetical protein
VFGIQCFQESHQRLRWIGVSLAADFVDFYGSVLGLAESGDGEFALDVYLVDGILFWVDWVEILFDVVQMTASSKGRFQPIV